MTVYRASPGHASRSLQGHFDKSRTVYLRKLFAAKYNISPKQYILDTRIQKAKHLLTNSPYSITAIGTDCGFSSVYIFSRCFKGRVGLTPSEYAKINRKFEL